MSGKSAVPPKGVPENQTQSGLTAEEWFEMGPDQKGIRRARPYFLVPLFREEPERDRKLKPTIGVVSADNYQATRRRIQERIRAHLLAQREQAPGLGQGPVTDVFVISHGWHRNFYAGIAAYDRLSSRMALLIGDGRMPLPPGTPFNPLFITLHWHSDPGEDDWMDNSGRRHKASFMRTAATLFMLEPQNAQAYAAKPPVSANPMGYAPAQLEFVRDFERIFEYFSQLSAPDRSHTWDANKTQNPDRLKQMAEDLYAVLTFYTVKEDCLARPEDKVVIAWRCYHEAKSRGVQVDAEKPESGAPEQFLSGGQSVFAVARFVTMILGLPIVLLFVSKPILPFIGRHLPECLVALLGIAAASAIMLERNAKRREMWKQQHLREKPESGAPILRLGAYLALQLVCILPLLFRCFLTYLLGALRQKPVMRLYDERNTDEPIPRDVQLARYPVTLLTQAVGPDSSAMPLAQALDSQMAFWEMQRRGARTGDMAGTFLNDLMQANPETFGADATTSIPRVHLLGHSFGGLVVANAARKMHGLGCSGAIRSLCLLEGALASGWLRDEPGLVKQITLENRGVITSIFSRYDTANGYIYPLVSQGRQALGGVGMCAIPINGQPPIVPEWRNGFASLVSPPDLQVTRPCMLNIDASRLIYYGQPALGGGHDDIYKDDVLHLLWAVTHIPANLQAAAQQPKAAEST